MSRVFAVPPVGVKVSWTLTFSLPLLALLRPSHHLSFFSPALVSLMVILAARRAPTVTLADFTGDLREGPRVRVPGPGSVTLRASVPFLVFAFPPPAP